MTNHGTDTDTEIKTESAGGYDPAIACQSGEGREAGDGVCL